MSRPARALPIVLLALGLGLATAGCGPDPDDEVPQHPQLPDDDDDDAGDDDAADDDGADDDASDDDAGDDDTAPASFPPFFTANDEFFELHIGPVPAIPPETFSLTVGGLVDQPGSFTLAQLQALPAVEIPLTVECIGNAAGGQAVDTARWSGFLLADLLAEVGVQPGAAAVRFLAEDGYHSSVTLDQAVGGDVIGVLTMNGEPLPPNHGAPLRFVLPGYYGVKHPGWVTTVEVVDAIPLDYWDIYGWDCSPPMDVDSRFFFPATGAPLPAGEPFEVGGAAWSAGRIAAVEVSPDDGQTWVDAAIVEQIDADGVWVFWSAQLTIDEIGTADLRARATDGWGNVQPDSDPTYLDGTNGWPTRHVEIVAP